MANRSYRTFLAKLSLRLKVLEVRLTMLKEVGDVCKQIWYVPFIWSLAWYLSWIFFSVAIWHKPLAQVNPLNYVGAATSIAVPLFGTQLRTQIKKAFVLAETQLRTIVRKAVPLFGTKLRACVYKLCLLSGIDTGKIDRMSYIFAGFPIGIGSQVEKSRQLRQQVKQSSQKRHRRVEKPKQAKRLTQELSPSVNNNPQNIDYPRQRHEPEEMPKKIPDKCLICADLINCVYLRNKSYDLESQLQKYIPCQKIQDSNNFSEARTKNLKNASHQSAPLL